MRRLLIVLALVAALSQIGWATTYYVSLAGSNANPGTSLSAPLGTIQAAVDKTKPGDTVLIRGGVYKGRANRLRTSKKGTAGAPIIIQAYQQEDVVLDCERVKLLKDGDIAGRAYGWLFWGAQDIIMDGIHIKDVGVIDQPGGDYANEYFGIWVMASQNITIQNCKVSGTRSQPGDYGPNINLEGSHSGYNVTGCIVRNCELWDASNTNNHNASGVGICKGATDNLVENNLIYSCGSGVHIKSTTATKNIISKNVIRKCGTAIFLDGGCIAEQNVIHDCGGGIDFHAGYGSNGPATIQNNTIYNCSNFGIDDGNNSGTDHITDVSLFNNIIAECGAKSLRSSPEWGATGATEPPGWNARNNCYWDGSSNTVVRWKAKIWTLAQLQQSMGYEKNSIQKPPLFVNANSQDFHLTSGSPCKKTGEAGADMGAYITGKEIIGLLSSPVVTPPAGIPFGTPQVRSVIRSSNGMVAVYNIRGQRLVSSPKGSRFDGLAISQASVRDGFAQGIRLMR